MQPHRHLGINGDEKNGVLCTVLRYSKLYSGDEISSLVYKSYLYVQAICFNKNLTRVIDRFE